MEDHIAGKGTNSSSHYNQDKFILVPQAMKLPVQRQQWEKNGENEKNRHGI